MHEPLAIKLRPTKLDDVLGQSHLIGKNKVLTNLVANKRLFSMILYGKPGIGKNALAQAIVYELNLPYLMLNAVINKKKDFDDAFIRAKKDNGLILIVDEIHRLNKDKQDLLLPQLEHGLITLIGLTTANPYHKINPAIRSRCQLFKLNELENDDILLGLKRALKSDYLPGIKISTPVLEYIVNLAAGDLRYAYNLLEVAYYAKEDKHITLDHLKTINNKPIFFHDKNEDGHYDVLSAFQKSIRGSDVNASLHYLARLLEVEDLDSIFRRLLVIAYEDIGLANSMMGVKVIAAIGAAERLGLPEARIPLAKVVIELALSPKSNSSIVAIDTALADIRSGITGNVPEHLKTYSKNYKYPHEYPNSYVTQQYLPDNIKNKNYYVPKDNQYEEILKNIKAKLEQNKNTQ